MIYYVLVQSRRFPTKHNTLVPCAGFEKKQI